MVDDGWEPIDSGWEPITPEGPLAQLAQKAPSAAPLIGAAEGAASFGTSLAAPLVGGLAGLGTEAANLLGLTDKTGGDVSNAVSDALTYHPETQGGQGASDILSTPFRKLQEVGNAAAERILDAKPVDLDKVPDALKAPAYVYNKAAGSPEFATAATTAVQMLPTLLGGGEVKVKAVEKLAGEKNIGASIDADLSGHAEGALEPQEPITPQQRLKELRVQRREGLTPDEHAEYTDLLEKDAFQGKVKGNGAYIEGTGNSDALNHYHDAETVPQVKLDLDNFKPVNDALGHPAGDVLIQHTGEELAKEFPPDADGVPSVFHHGGDEFTIVPKLDETLAGVQKRVETVREQIKNTPVELTDTKGDTSVHPGVDFSLGAGEGHAAASDSLTHNKADREASGIRRPRYNRSTDTPGAEQGAADSVPARAERPASQVDVQDAGAIQQRVVRNADGNAGAGNGPTGVRGVEETPRSELPAGNRPTPVSGNTEVRNTAEAVDPLPEVSARNAAIDESRTRMGLEPMAPAERKGWQATRDEAAAMVNNDPGAAEKIIADHKATERPLTDAEQVVLAEHAGGIEKKWAAADTALSEAKKSGDGIAAIRAEADRHYYETKAHEVHGTLKTGGGTANARSLGIRNAILGDRYTIGRNMERAEASYGNLTDRLRNEAREHSQAIAKAKQELEEIQAKQEKARQPQNRTKMTDEAREHATVKRQVADKLKKIQELQSRVEKRLKACPI